MFIIGLRLLVCCCYPLFLNYSHQYRVTIQLVHKVVLKSKQRLRFSIRSIYRVTKQLVQSLPLTFM